MSSGNAFAGRELVIATMHGKEQVLQPLLEKALGVTVQVAADIDTDAFGTFSGEVERPGSPLETARMKCRKANQITGAGLVLASEGSFGAHPVAGFVPANEELLLLTDFEHNREFRASVLSTETNFSAKALCSMEEVLQFAGSVGFPEHGLIMRREQGAGDDIVKGINDMQTLQAAASRFLQQYGQVFVETDMRAHFNPTRQKVIAAAAEKLISLLQTHCPACGAPGFAVKEVIRGLPCKFCLSPTNSARALLHECDVCGFSTEKSREDKKFEDPMFCDQCNP